MICMKRELPDALRAATSSEVEFRLQSALRAAAARNVECVLCGVWSGVAMKTREIFPPSAAELAIAKGREKGGSERTRNKYVYVR
jgi:hypothetical protein